MQHLGATNADERFDLGRIQAAVSAAPAAAPRTHWSVALAAPLLLVTALPLAAATPPTKPQPRQTQRQIDVCFCDDEDCTMQLIEAIDFAERSIHASIDATAASEVIEALQAAAEREVDVHVVLTLGRRGDPGAEFETLVALGAEVLTRRDSGETQTQHLVIDAETVVTGTSLRPSSRSEQAAGELWVARGVPELAAKMLERWEAEGAGATRLQRADAQQAAHNESAAPPTSVYVTPSGKKYHRADCPYAKTGTPVSLEEARKAGKGPCRQCKPDEGAAAASAKSPPGSP